MTREERIAVLAEAMTTLRKECQRLQGAPLATFVVPFNEDDCGIDLVLLGKNPDVAAVVGWLRTVADILENGGEGKGGRLRCRR